MSNTGTFLTGFILGGLTGAAAALLMTPQPGEATRIQLQERSTELKTQFDDLTAETRGRMQERGAELKTQLDDLTAEARVRMQERGRTVISAETVEAMTDAEDETAAGENEDEAAA